MGNPLLSKINWAQLVGLLAMFTAMFGLDVPADVQAQIAVAITAIISVVTWVLRTFFHKPKQTL
jgi:hypothetical protein